MRHTIRIPTALRVAGHHGNGAIDFDFAEAMRPGTHSAPGDGLGRKLCRADFREGAVFLLE